MVAPTSISCARVRTSCARGRTWQVEAAPCRPARWPTLLFRRELATRPRAHPAIARRAGPPSASGDIGQAIAARASVGDDTVTMPEDVRAPKSHRLLRSRLPQFLHEKRAKMAPGARASPSDIVRARPPACGPRPSIGRMASSGTTTALRLRANRDIIPVVVHRTRRVIPGRDDPRCGS